MHELLTEFHKHPLLKGKLVLKGGTALNLFYLNLARLPELWTRVAEDLSRVLDGRLQVEAAVASPGGNHLAVCLETKSWLGLKTRRAGCLYTIRDRAAVGRVVLGKREPEGWVLEKVF